MGDRLQPWEGIPFGLFKRSSSPQAGTRLGVTGTVLGIGSGKPLDLRLYAFLPPEQLALSLRLLTYEFDAWKRRPRRFLGALGYHVRADSRWGRTGRRMGRSVTARFRAGGPAYGQAPGYGQGYGRPDSSVTDSIACVNKRTGPTDGRSLEL